MYCDTSIVNQNEQQITDKDSEADLKTKGVEEENKAQHQAPTPLVTNLEKEKQKDIRMTIEFIENNRLIFSKSFLNKTILRNLVLKRKDINPKVNQEITQYQLNCYLDMTECPSCLCKASEYQSNYFWHIRLFSSDLIVFVQSTIKEDKEKEIIRSWEANQQGRGEKSKLSRRQFLIKKKKQIEDEGLNILTGEKQKAQTVIESNSNMIITNIPPSNHRNQFNEFHLSHKPFPTIESYHSLFMKNFVVYTTSERIIVKNTRNKSNELPLISHNYCLTEEEKAKERESIIERYNRYYQSKNEENKFNDNKAKQMGLDLEHFAEKLHSNRAIKNNNLMNNVIALKNEIIANEYEFDIQLALLKDIIVECDSKDSKCDFNNAYKQLKQTMNMKQMKKNSKGIIIEAINRLSKKKEELIINDILNIGKCRNAKEIIDRHITDLNDNILKVSKEIYRQLNNIKDKLSG